MDQLLQVTDSFSNQSIELLQQIEVDLTAEDVGLRQQAQEIAAHTDILSLPWLPLENRAELPNVPGIYFLLEDERVIYIGLSKKSILRRWWTHPKLKELKQRTGEFKIAWLECRALLLLPVIESALIERFGKPELNRKRGNRIMPITQSPQLYREMEEQIEYMLVGLRRTDWALVKLVADKLQLQHHEALGWIVRLGASATPGRYHRMLNKLEKELQL